MAQEGSLCEERVRTASSSDVRYFHETTGCFVRNIIKQPLVLIEINFEEGPEYSSLFSSNDPVKTLEKIRNALNIHALQLKLVDRGGVAEQVVGQLFKTIESL